MKVIDLLNKIAKGEEVPKKIAYTPLDGCRYILNYDPFKKDYYDGQDYLMNSPYDIIHYLNDEVEIIEEDKEIEDIQELKNRKFTRNQKQIADKINEIVIAVNELKKKDTNN